jgi:hypothetical protein
VKASNCLREHFLRVTTLPVESSPAKMKDRLTQIDPEQNTDPPAETFFAKIKQLKRTKWGNFFWNPLCALQKSQLRRITLSGSRKVGAQFSLHLRQIQ